MGRECTIFTYILSPSSPCLSLSPHHQDYDAMIELVEALPDHDQILKAPVQYLYAFALNRCNSPGYRDKALNILEEVRKLST